MNATNRFQLSNKRTIKSRMVKPTLSDPSNKLDCGATGGSIVSTALM